jgi:pimeloyl-ACP methyl ester carboxylesterase
MTPGRRGRARWPERITAGLETWRVLNGDALPFDEPEARRFVEASYDRAADFAAANYDRAGRTMTHDRLAPLSKIPAPTLVVHGTEDPSAPCRTAVGPRRADPPCPAGDSLRDGTRLLLSWPAPSRRPDHPRPDAFTGTRHLTTAAAKSTWQPPIHQLAAAAHHRAIGTTTAANVTVRA